MKNLEKSYRKTSQIGLKPVEHPEHSGSQNEPEKLTRARTSETPPKRPKTSKTNIYKI